MSKTLPKGHLSCLSTAFRYTPASHTNVAETFARIARELKERREASTAETPVQFVSRPVIVSRSFPLETVQSAWRLLRAGGLRSAPHRALVIAG